MKWRHSVANGGWTGRGVKVRDSSTRQTTPSQILVPWSWILDLGWFFYPLRWEGVLRGRRLDPRSRDDWQDSWGRLHCLHGRGHRNYICNYFLLHKSPHWTADQSIVPQMEDAGKFDYKIEFVGLFVLDEDFLLGEEKSITLPHTGEEVQSKHTPTKNLQQYWTWNRKIWYNFLGGYQWKKHPVWNHGKFVLCWTTIYFRPPWNSSGDLCGWAWWGWIHGVDGEEEQRWHCRPRWDDRGGRGTGSGQHTHEGNFNRILGIIFSLFSPCSFDFDNKPGGRYRGCVKE